MTSTFIMVHSPREAHQALNDLFQQEIKPHCKTGAAGIVSWQTTSHYLRHQLRKAFHGYVLRDIAEQVWLHDPRTGMRVRYAPLAWKNLFRQMFVEPTFEEYTVRATGEIKVRERRRSTEELSDDEFQTFLLQVQAFAVVDLGVEFSEEDRP